MNSALSSDQPDPYVVLGVDPGASSAEITAAYRRAVRACHPDTPDPDRDRLAAVIAAYHRPRDQFREQEEHPPARGHPWSSARGVEIPVRVHPRDPPPAEPDLRAGPVRRHPPQR
ncbi:J domain-containing protein [Saccharopolyspora phatthalungensis]|uniref:Curved DNA-binding protein CbpA n=1 Tax=Saccharopolyspora phatthalungensis TaxID=664693 RepID=A0A840QA52_9PSEU|nr:J domain-containing protein [Saccharopolyspora phatthalungensis]MBB5157296.1 curved DNA-binding protein CbpA [Saccharopolyspora phatthalungensis]